eukprot:COSAG01_NODE_332_length_18712_cov_41.424358_19_plen_44_part_00
MHTHTHTRAERQRGREGGREGGRERHAWEPGRKEGNAVFASAT